MAEANKSEAKVAKHVEEAAAKIKGLYAASNTPNEHDTRLREILTTLALRATLIGLPETCKECEEKLDIKLSVRCPKHVGLMLAADYAKAKAKEHGPVLMAKAAMGVQAWFEKLTADAEKDGEGPEKPE